MPLPEVDVSIVIPCRDDCASLLATLDAIAAQDHPEERRETIVVDGTRGGECQEAIRGRGARLLRDSGLGPAAARNLGIRAARGRIVAFTDADCVPRFDWLTRLMAPFEQDDGLAGVAGAMRLPRETLIGRLEDNDARWRYGGYITSNVAYRRSVLLGVGGFDETLRCAEDYDLAWRILDAGRRIAHEPRAVVLHAPPEVQGTLVGYLAKQFWYARSDVPAHALAFARWRARPEASGSRGALVGARGSFQQAAFVLGIGLGVALRSPGLVGAAFAGIVASSARDVARSLSAVGAGAEEVLTMTGVESAKRLVRGVGTLAGVARLALPAALPALSARGVAAWRARARAPHLAVPA